MASRNQRRKNGKIANENVEILEKKKRNNPIMWVISVIILIVIVVTFIGAPLTSGGASRGSIVFGSYDGEDITYYEGSFFSDQVAGIAEQYRDSMNDSNAMFIQYQVWRAAFDNTVFRTASIKEMKNSGALVSSGAVDENIVLYGPYMENGEFSENLYAQSSNTEKKYIRQRFEEDLYYSRFVSDLNSTKMSNNESDFFKDLAIAEKKYRFVTFPYTSFPEDKIAEYGSKNADLFRSIVISRITINSDKKAAEQIMTKLEENPAMFTELAKTQSSDPYADKGGEMGKRYYYELKNVLNNEDVLDKIFNLKKGEISGIIESDENWVIYRCDKTPEYADLSLSSELNNVKNYMERYEKGVIEDYLVEMADNFVEFAASEGFTMAAQDSSLTVHESDFFPIIYGNPSVSYYGQDFPIYTQPSSDNTILSSASNNEFFLKSINNLGLNDISGALILDDNVLVMQLIEEKQKGSEELNSIPELVGFAAQNWLNSQYQKDILESDKFKDNFSEVFSRLFVSN